MMGIKYSTLSFTVLLMFKIECSKTKMLLLSVTFDALVVEV